MLLFWLSRSCTFDFLGLIFEFLKFCFFELSKLFENRHSFIFIFHKVNVIVVDGNDTNDKTWFI